LTKDGESLFGPAREIINEDNLRAAFDVNVHINEVRINDRSYVSVLAISSAGPTPEGAAI
jgi:hypothetical protein